MLSTVRSTRFNYNPDYTGPRFYSFSTWADDITRHFTSSSGTVCAPAAFLALNIKPESFTTTENGYPLVMNALERYFENKLAWLRGKYLSDPDKIGEFIERYQPLRYLLEGLWSCGAWNAGEPVLLEDIAEQNYAGTFTDIVCTVPHGCSAKTIASGFDSKCLTEYGDAHDVKEIEYDTKSATERTPDSVTADGRWYTTVLEAVAGDATSVMTYYYGHSKSEIDEMDRGDKIVFSIENAGTHKYESVSMTADDVDMVVAVDANGEKTVHKIPAGETETVQWIRRDERPDGFTITLLSSGWLKINAVIMEIVSDETVSTRFATVSDTLVGWTDRSVVTYDTWDTVNLEGSYQMTYSEGSAPTANLTFQESDDKTFGFNCVIPLYQEWDRDVNSYDPTDSRHKLDMTKMKPLGIWFNELDDNGAPKTISVTTAASGQKYTASWSLSISTQIKPAYASNSVPVKYTDNNDMAVSMNTFAGVLQRVSELSDAVK